MLFLIANFSATGEILNMTKDIQLPTATHVDELELAPVIMVSNDDIIINGISVARVADLSRDDYVTIPALEEKLREQKKETEELHALANDGTALKGEAALIVTHVDRLAELLTTLFDVSCLEAGLLSISRSPTDIAEVCCGHSATRCSRAR